jgi:hypothetical protein
LQLSYDVIICFEDVARKGFLETPDGEIKQAIRQKCSNAVKSLKIKGLLASKATTVDD